MLYKFKSKETSDLIMLEPHARHVLSLIGKEPGAQGIVLPDEMAQAIQRLQDAIQAEEFAKAEAAKLAAEKSQTADVTEVHSSHTEPSRHVSLRQRVTPFIDMLKRAQAAHVEVVWGV
jgi:hypothetical protein